MSHRLDILAFGPVLARRARAFEELGPLPAEVHVSFEGSKQRVDVVYTLPSSQEDQTFVIRLSDAHLDVGAHVRVFGAPPESIEDAEEEEGRVYAEFAIDASASDASEYARTLRPKLYEVLHVVLGLQDVSTLDDARLSDTQHAAIDGSRARDRLLGLHGELWGEGEVHAHSRDALHAARTVLRESQRRVARAAQNAHRLVMREEALRGEQAACDHALQRVVQSGEGEGSEARTLFERAIRVGHEQREVALWRAAAQKLVRLLQGHVEERHAQLTRILESDRHRRMLQLGDEALTVLRGMRYNLETEVRDLNGRADLTEAQINRVLSNARSQALQSKNDLARMIAREKRLRQQLDQALDKARSWEERIKTGDPTHAEKQRALALIDAQATREMWRDHTLVVQHLQSLHRRVESLVLRVQHHKQSILFARLVERAQDVMESIARAADPQHIHTALAHTRNPRSSINTLIRAIDAPRDELERLWSAAKRRRSAWREEMRNESNIALEWGLRAQEALRMDRDELAHEASATQREHEANAARCQTAYELSQKDVDEMAQAIHGADAVMKDLKSRKFD